MVLKGAAGETACRARWLRAKVFEYCGTVRPATRHGKDRTSGFGSLLGAFRFAEATGATSSSPASRVGDARVCGGAWHTRVLADQRMVCVSEVGGSAADTAMSCHESSHWLAYGPHADAALVAGSALPACSAGFRRRNPTCQGVRRSVWAVTPHAALLGAWVSPWWPQFRRACPTRPSSSSHPRRLPFRPRRLVRSFGRGAGAQRPRRPAASCAA